MHTVFVFMERTKENIEENIKENTLCVVTSFLDIGRSEWTTYSRTVNEYFTSFIPYLRLDHDIIVFIDDKHAAALQALIDADVNAANIMVIPINREWMKRNIYAYSKLDMENKIMQSEDFKKIIQHRTHCPETYSPEYNIMQHSKIDFVCYAIERGLSKAEYFAWSDFGYFKTNEMQPKSRVSKLDLTKFNLSKINFQTINEVDDKDAIIMYTLIYAPEKIGGFFYLGSKDLLKEYQSLYHSVYEKFHRMGLVDDDQHFMLQCYFAKKDIFHLWNLGGWHKIYTTFCM